MQTITEIPEPSIPLCRALFPPPSYADPINWSGTEYMAAFLDFTGSGTPQVVAGFSPAPSGDVLKPYQVALAVPTGPNSRPLFGTELPQFEGTVFSNNTFGSPNLEFSIKDFSQLYQAITGQTLTSSSTIYLGADAGSSQDGPTSEAFFPEQPVNVGAATIPGTCPPASPPILVNPHEHRVVDTAHRDLVRVYIEGTSGFDPTTINPATAQLDGAKPIANFTRHFPHLEFPVETFVFVGKDLNLPAGYTNATFTAQTYSGQQITTSKQVLNIPFSAKVPGRLHFLMDKGSAYPDLARLEASKPSAVTLGNTTTPLASSVKLNLASRETARAVRVNYKAQVSSSGTTTPVAAPRSVVSLNSSRAARASNIPRGLPRA